MERKEGAQKTRLSGEWITCGWLEYWVCVEAGSAQDDYQTEMTVKMPYDVGPPGMFNWQFHAVLHVIHSLGFVIASAVSPIRLRGNVEWSVAFLFDDRLHGLIPIIPQVISTTPQC
jgi:hypothetical protein